MRLCILALVLLTFATLARAEDLRAAFDSANKLYGQGKYLEAAAAYEKLAQSGKASAPLYFNLGNAFFKAGQIGRALAAYRQAEQLTPRDPDLRANLQFARNQIQGPTLVPGRVQRWLGRLTLNEWTVLAAGALWFWFLLLAALQLRPALKPALRGYVAPLGVIAGLLCICFAAAFYQTHTRSAIVAARNVVVRASPLEESQDAFTVHDGAELRVLDQKEDWLQVSADPRRVGWLPKTQVLLVPGS